MSAAHSRRARIGRGTIVVVFIATALAGGCSNSQTGAPQPSQGRVIGPLALGVNVAAWDNIFDHIDPTTIDNLLKSGGLRLLRFPGGGWADEYDWSTDVDSSKCTGAITSACSAVDPLSFDDFSVRARSESASTFVTVNYGSGTPREAAAWVTRAATMRGHAVALWEVGNETYSCYETNDHLAEAPTFVKGYTPAGTVCPSTAQMARSYAAHVLPYLDAMKRANPAIKIGVPWAFNGEQSAGTGVKEASLWNGKVLRTVENQIGFVDAHWYPFDQVAGLSDQQILASIRRIPAAAAQIRSTLHRDAPGANFVIGESNISERLTTLDFQPVSALFAAATSLAWLSQGAESVDWWDLNNYGSPTEGDYGLVSSGNPETELVGTPFPPYYGEVLASKLANSGSHIKAVDTGSAKVLGFQSDLGHRRQVLLINTSLSTVSSAATRWFSSGSDLNSLTYSPSTANASSPIAHSTAKTTRSLVLPAESILVLSGNF